MWTSADANRRPNVWAACPTCGGNWCGMCLIVHQGDRLHLRCMACLDEFDIPPHAAVIDFR